MKLCSIEGCKQKHEAKGYCRKHYRAFWKYGDPLATPIRKEYPKNVKRKSRVHYEENHKIINDVEHKLCSVCEEWLPMNEDNYYKNNSNAIDGFNPYCKQCTKDRAWKWQKDNWDNKMLAHFKRENAKPEKKKRVKELNRIRRENGEYRKWQRSERGRKSSKRAQEKRKSKKHNITPKEWEDCKTYFNQECAYCGMNDSLHKEVYKQQLHKEHVIADGRNDLKNCVPSCRTCNSEKNVQTVNQFYNPSNSSYTRERYLKIVEWIRYDVKRFIVKKRKKMCK